MDIKSNYTTQRITLRISHNSLSMAAINRDSESQIDFEPYILKSGISMAANKVHGIRCAHCADTVEARLTREHNDANMMAIGAGFTGELLALEMVDVFLNTPFSEGERHARRVAKVNAIQP